MSAAVTLTVCLSLLVQAPDSDVAVVSRWLPGTYDTFAQAAAADSSGAAYRHVRAVLRIVRLTIDDGADDAAGAPAFYLEQALAGQEGAPYRQRVIVLRWRDGALMNELHRLRDPSAFVGFDGGRSVRPEDLVREPGCDASWQRVSAHAFRGSAGGAGECRSTLRGATHVRSSFELTRHGFVTLDQGLDDAGAVRWGPPIGETGYRFVKRP